ncbi:MAG: hypothetical protein QME77_11995 [bacterium]|nr:hypothetical protein [bacterium]
MTREARSRLRQQVRQWQEQQWRLEAELLRLSRGVLVRGSLVPMYKACNKGGCKCTRGELHGPYWYLSWSEAGRTRMYFVKAAGQGRVRAAATRYRRWRQGRVQLVKLQQRILEGLNALEAAATRPVEEVEGAG